MRVLNELSFCDKSFKNSAVFRNRTEYTCLTLNCFTTKFHEYIQVTK